MTHPPLLRFRTNAVYVNKMAFDFWFICGRQICQGLLEDGPLRQRNCSLSNFGFTSKESRITSQEYNTSDIVPLIDASGPIRLVIERLSCKESVVPCFQYVMPPSGRKVKPIRQAYQKLNVTNREWFGSEIGRIILMRI